MAQQLFKNDCVFCQRAASSLYDGATTSLNDPTVINFEPLNPVTPGHRLFLPKYHIEHGPFSGNVVGITFRAAHEFATRSRNEDFNLIISSGSAATQTQPHIHVHYVPRRKGDGLTLPWTTDL